MSSLWNKIRAINGCRTARLPHVQYEVVLLPVPSLPGAASDSFWLVGEYRHLTDFAASLRNDQEAQDFVAGHHIRFGLRGTDLPPVNLARQQRYGIQQAGPNATKSFATQRTGPVALTANVNAPVPTNRRSDREENVRLYWLTQTAQSHHIVEYNNLHTIDASRKGGGRPLDHERLPCVLLAAEFHQRYISSALKHTHGMTKVDLTKEMISIYGGIYRTTCPPLAPLWQVSRAILRAAGFAVPDH